MGRNYKLNTIKVDIGSYRHYWRGVKKIGKTSLFRDLILAEYGASKYGLLISLGNETGYKALNNIIADEAQDWKTFIDIVDDLVKNKDDNEFKLVALDTIDELVSIAIKQAMDFHKEKTGKSGRSINDILGGYGAGRAYVTKLINDQLTRLERGGYGLVFIGHSKLRDIKEKGESEAYQVLSSNLEASWDNIFADKADIIATFYVDKIVESGKLVDKKRFIYFRDDGFIDCGSRLSGMPDKVEMNAKNYLKAFRQGVESSMEGFVTPEEFDRMKTEEVRDRQAIAKAYAKQEQQSSVEGDSDTTLSIEELKEQIINKLVTLGGSKNAKLMKLVKEFEPSGNPNRIQDYEKLTDLLERLEMYDEEMEK
jgi:hypothetical protein